MLALCAVTEATQNIWRNGSTNLKCAPLGVDAGVYKKPGTCWKGNLVMKILRGLLKFFYFTKLKKCGFGRLNLVVNLN